MRDASGHDRIEAREKADGGPLPSVSAIHTDLRRTLGDAAVEPALSHQAWLVHEILRLKRERNAPRDVVARAIHQEMQSGGVSCVYLDLRSHMSAERIRARFPNIHRDCLAYGVDMTRDLVPVVPAAHYACGGVWVDDCGRTSLDRLYAVGEVSCTGLHGANRLASASLLEGLVWGHRAARDILRGRTERRAPESCELLPWEAVGSALPDQALIDEDVAAIQHVMWSHVGLVRTARGLERAVHALSRLNDEIGEFYATAELTDALIGLRNAAATALAVAEAARANPRSAGCHRRV
jgi:L-aspartate oxidase